MAVPERSPGAGDRPDEERLRAGFREVVFRQLGPVSKGLALIYAVLAPAHLLFLEGAGRVVMASVAAASGIGLAVLARLTRRGRIPPEAADQASGLVAVVVLVNSVLHLAVSGEAAQATNLMLLIVGSASFLLSRGWFWSVTGAAGAGWLLVAPPGESAFHYSFALGLSAALGALIFAARRRMLSRLIGARDRAALQQERAVASEARVRMLLDTAADGILAFDADGRITTANPAAGALFGLDPDAMAGRDVEELMPRLRAQLGAGEHPEREVLGLRRDGTPFVAAVSLSRVAFGAGGFIAVVRDTTAQRELQLDLEQARDEAEAATRAKAAFLAAMSHEIRTPMNAVIGLTSLLRDTALDTEQRDFVETIRTSGDALLVIINDILDFSKMEAGRLELEYQPFDARDVVEEALELVTATAGRKRLELGYVVAEGAPTAIVSDINRVRQVLLNLLSNAVKFTDRGEVAVVLDGRDLPEGTRELEIVVRDTGIGIPPDRMDRLFQPFMQVDASTARRYGGTGLGLTISRRLVEAMGGTVSVESTPGQGSKFRFTIRGAPVSTPVRARVAGEHAELAGRRILIVDDNATNRFMVEQYTRAWGMVPSVAEDPGSALDLLYDAVPFDVAFIDATLPGIGLDGLTEELCREDATRATPLVLLRHRDPDGDRDADDTPIPFVAALDKPLRASQLLDVVNTLLGPETADERVVAAGAAVTGGGLRVLVAEDNATNQKVVRSVLDRLGHRAMVVADGDEALQALAAHPFDVVLMDVHMPGVDGLEATRRLRADFPPDRQPFVVALTASALDEERQSCLEAGMDDFLSKPFRKEDLARLLEAVPRPVPAEAAGEPAAGEPTARDAPAPAGTGPPAEAEDADSPAQSGPADDGAPGTGGVDGPAVDPGVLGEFAADLGEAGGEYVVEAVDAYLGEAPGLVDTMRAALADGDTEAFFRAAHSLKSSSAVVGALALSAMAADLEDQGRREDLTGAAGEVERAGDELERARKELEALSRQWAG